MTKLLIGLGILIIIGALFGALLTLWAKLFPTPEQEPPAAEERTEGTVRYVAVVHCTGGGASFSKYDYQGVRDCLAAAQLPGGGPLSCDYGCLGMGTCGKSCPSDAIRIQDGVAVVDGERCTACGKCIDACPRHLISLETFRPKRHVSIPCASKAQDEAVTTICTDGCIGCSICVKTCPREAMTVEEGLARIDYEKCDNCGMCAAKCPRHLIRVEKVVEPPKPEPPKPPKPPKEKKPKKGKELKQPKGSPPSNSKWSLKKGKTEKEETVPQSAPVEREPMVVPAPVEEEQTTIETDVPADQPVSEPVVKVEEPLKSEPEVPAEEKRGDGAKTSAEAFKAFEQAVAAVGEVLGEEKEEGSPKEAEPAAAAADSGTKTE